MSIDRSERLAAYGAGIALFVWFAFLIRGGLVSWFDGDDIMNLHYYWSQPWPALLKANVFFWSSYLRPARRFVLPHYLLPLGIPSAAVPHCGHGVALRRLRAACLGCVATDGIAWGRTVGAALVGINPTFSAAYFETGAIYDVLAYAFFWGAFALYVYLRRKGRVPGLLGEGSFCVFSYSHWTRKRLRFPSRWLWRMNCSGIRPMSGDPASFGAGSAVKAGLQPSAFCSTSLT